jgi:hypothetical protein
MDSDGTAELQTDVMRFMAILAFCLVAIFALVQAIPSETRPEPADRSAPKTATATTPETPPAAKHSDAPAPVPDPPRAAEPLTISAPPAARSAAQSDEAGFALRFESDDALKALVARSDVGLYAMRGDEAMRLHIARGRIEFWAASMPTAFHEMETATVPADVVTAHARVSDGRDAVRWGVTLPPRLSRDIDQRLATGQNGDLVIAANGRLRQE